MSQLIQIFNFIVTCIQGYINALSQNWLSSTFLYLLVLNIIVTTILIVRGHK